MLAQREKDADDFFTEASSSEQIVGGDPRVCVPLVAGRLPCSAREGEAGSSIKD